MNKYCISCGSIIPEESNFCINCGTKVQGINNVNNSNQGYTNNLNNVNYQQSNLENTYSNGVNTNSQNNYYNNHQNSNMSSVNRNNMINNNNNNNISQINNSNLYNNNNMNQGYNSNQYNNYNNMGQVNNTNNYNNMNQNSNYDPHSGLKVASLVLGIIAILGSLIFNILIIPLALVGLILGIIYKSKTKKMAPGIILNIIGMVIPIIIIVIALLAYNVVSNKVDDTLNNLRSDVENNTEMNDYYDDEIYLDDGENNQRIGNDDFGYIDVPSDWTRFYSVNGTDFLQYSYNNLWILTLYAVDNENINADKQYADLLLQSLIDDGAIDTNLEQDYVGKYNAYKISGYYEEDNIWLVAWSFLDENNKLHYLAIEGPSKNSEYFDLIDTFSIEE